MLRRILYTLMVCLVGAGTAFAQTGTLTGTVTDASSGEPLIGVNIFLAELQRGATTDVQGDFEIENIEYGSYTIRVSYIGYDTHEQRLVIDSPAANIEVALVSQLHELDDVVVTAFGVERSQRSLGYASQSVSTEEMTKISESNFVNTLQGKVAGVKITSGSGTLGSSSRILLRGVSSLAGDNQPLFVVDGVYVDNSNFDPGEEFGGHDFGNAAMDINPNDIASINVLKGANAAALYGSRAANGVIIITTKDGRSRGGSGIGVSVNSSVTFEEVLVLPDMQNEYGQGSGGEFVYVNGAGGGKNDGTDESWGPRLDGTPRVQWWTNGEERPWVASPNNVRDFFNTGVDITNNVAVAGTYGDANFRLSATNSIMEGVFPNNTGDRSVFSLNAGAQVTDDFRIDGRVSYNQTIFKNRPGVGYSSQNPMQSLTQWFGRQVDINRLRDYKKADGTPRNWNYNYHDNPFWVMYENTNRQQRDRITGNIDLVYDFTDWLALRGKTGTDFYTERREFVTAMNTINDPNGLYEEGTYYVNEWTSNLFLEAVRDLNEDVSLNARLGVERVDSRWERNIATANALIVPNLYNLSNSAVRPQLDDYTSRKRINSAIGTATIGYQDYIYLDVSVRNDWSSTLPSGNNSYLYPSASLSFIISDALDINAPWLTYAKLRGSWSQVGNDTDPYQLQSYFIATDEFGEIPTFTVDNTIAFSELKPERKTSYEVGANIRFFNNRLGLDVTYYDESTVNQILSVPMPRSTGYDFRTINAGEIANRGLEVSVDATPVQKSNFRWDMMVNWSTNQNEVVELTEGVGTYEIGSSWDVTVEARPGEEFGTLRGYGFLRDEEGNIVVGSNGVPLVDGSELKSFGSYQPDWLGGIRNTFSYKNWGLSFLIDGQKGGKLSSVTYMFGRYTGILKETLEGREGGFVFDGGRWADGAVKQNGEPNDIAVDAQTFNGGTFFGNAESHIFDATYVKLREARLTYSLPVTMLEGLPFRNIDLSLVGRNLFIIYKAAPHIDPETAFSTGNLQGLESNQHPSVRSVGFNVSISL